MKKALPWLLGAALAVGACAITVVTPSEDDLRAPFRSVGAFDPGSGVQQSATARTLTASVVDAVFTERVEDGEWHADGSWLVVTLAASAPHSELDSSLELAALRVGDEVFHASERPRDAFLGEGLRIGIDTVGMLAFELPADVRHGDAELQLSTSGLTPRLDDLVALSIPLDELPMTPHIEIEPPETQL